ncbi:MAG: hypothetical protein HY343_01065 [Lentisphaerae bacterium]|nr:hypothetical protein [Lentisphaerota bacterium]
MQMRFDDDCFQALQHLFQTEGPVRLGEFLQSRKGHFDNPADGELAGIAAGLFPLVAEKRYPEVVQAVVRASEKHPALPSHLLNLGLFAAKEAGLHGEMAWAIFRFAEAAADRGETALAMEMVKKIYVFAAGRDAEMYYKPDCLVQVAALLEKIARPGLARRAVPLQGPPKTKPRLALVTPVMLEGTTAWAKTALQFVRYRDSAACDVYEYFADETVNRKQYFLGHQFVRSKTSEETAPRAMAELRAGGAVVKCIPPTLDWAEGSRWLAEELERDGIDAVIFQGNVETTMMWMASRWTHVPVKMTLCVGVNMYQTGQAATIYMSNRLNLEKEQAFWRPEWGRQVFMGGGADIAEAARTPPLNRAEFAIPPGAVAFGMLSNDVSVRVTEEYLACVAKVLKACPEAVFVCMGSGDVRQQIGCMTRAGVLDRCRWLSWQHMNAFASLKMLDFYYNEIPIGGSQVLIECMACGVPALAMVCGTKHHETVGADVVGPEFAIMEKNPDAYVARAVEWIRDPVRRAAAGKAQLARARQLYSAETFIRDLCRLALELGGREKKVLGVGL